MLLIAAALALPLALPLASPAAAQVAPHERWRSLESEHFRVTYPAGLDSLARVTAARSEEAYGKLATRFVRPPRGRIEVLLTDHVDFSNGFATVIPYPQLTIFARPPIDGFALSHFDDWLEMVITHELVHVFHLDFGGPLASLMRAVFGRVPAGWPYFPQGAAPRWVIEGLATWYESALTEAGRVRGTHQEMALRTAVLEGRFENLGQASGLSPVWPAGTRPYIFGSSFFDYLARTYGEARMGTFVEAVAGQWIPYRLNAAARRAFGVSFSRAWGEWERELSAEVGALAATLARHAPLTEPLAVTADARQAFHPQVSPDGNTLLFARSDGHSDAQLRRAAPDGSAQGRLTRTNGLSVFSWLPDGGVLFAQFQLMDPYHIRSDLHVRAPGGGERRVTRGARLDHPSPTPDGRAAVAVEYGPGTTALVEVDLESGAVRPLGDGDPAAHWAFPRVSPDGRWIAASRWLPGAFFDVVILDRSGRVVAEVTRDRALDIAPAWSPDGRWIVWGSDRSGIPNLLAASVDPESGGAGAPRQVTNLLTGAAFPSVDPSGRWIYFSGYHADGWDIERIPFDPSAWTEPLPLDARFLAGEPHRAPAALPGLEERPYAPMKTLLPRHWQPDGREPIAAGGRTIIGTGVGVSTNGRDLVGRHAFDAATVFSTTGEVDGFFSYRYAGLGNPVLSLTADQFWDASGPFRAERAEGVIDSLFITQRERRLSAAATLRRPGFRVSSQATASAGVVWEERSLLDNRLEPETGFRLQSPSSRLADARASLSLSSARAHAFAIGLADGVTALVQGRTRTHLALADSLAGDPNHDRGFDEALARVQAYRALPLPGFARHVLALRGSFGAARGPGAGSAHFRVGGASGGREPITGFALLGGTTFFFPVRGYDSGARRGRYAAALSGEYRFPLARINRGLGLFPLHFEQTSGTLFADGGNAWNGGAADAPRRQTLASVGAELLLDVLTFYQIPVTLRAGVGLPLVEGDGASVYLRFGRSF